ncbi:hypothetical protein [Microvirga lotononidis]|uniref:Uncharacterized protein n=1 Tax=Microvirga lotononidis TaxID=864069 RepID=I4YMI5_9HYPH|nr:hypothetical protein [Microvirga lotononidis]EIM25177.1 hypothetical protein MicloDRAFT_00058980 [Microvirga lotononidis]WQO29337.1 hypothetical protein U0023_09830 [Microvirga lotononidis]
MRGSIFVRAVLLCGTALAVPAQAKQLPGPRILKIDLRVEGSEGWQTKVSSEKGTISERFFLATVLEPSDSLDAMNPLDPDSIRKAQETSARQIANVQKIQDRNRALAPAAAPNAAMQQQVNQAIMQSYARCKGDEACIKAAVMQSNPGLMTPPPGATMKPGIPDTSTASPEERAVYRQWFGVEGCPGKFRATRNDVSQGSVADVGASKPWNHEARFDIAQAKSSLCLSYPMSVVNEEAGTLFLPGFLFPEIPAVQKSMGAVTTAVPGEIAAWAAKTLKGAPLSGTNSETINLTRPILVLPLANASYKGSVKVTMTWSLTEGYKAGAALPDQ